MAASDQRAGDTRFCHGCIRRVGRGHTCRSVCPCITGWTAVAPREHDLSATAVSADANQHPFTPDPLDEGFCDVCGHDWLDHQTHPTLSAYHSARRSAVPHDVTGPDVFGSLRSASSEHNGPERTV